MSLLKQTRSFCCYSHSYNLIQIKRSWFSCHHATQSNFMPSYWILLICLFLIFMESKSKVKEQIHIMNSVMQRKEFSYALMLQLEVWIFQKSIGLYNMILLMTQKNTSTELVELAEDLILQERHWYFYYQKKKVIWVT